MQRPILLVAALLSAGWSRGAAQVADTCSAKAAQSSMTLGSYPTNLSTPRMMAELDSIAMALGYTQVTDGGLNGQNIFEMRSRWPQGIGKSYRELSWWTGRPFPGIRLTFGWAPWGGSRFITVTGSLVCAPSDTSKVVGEQARALATVGLYQVLDLVASLPENRNPQR